MGISEETTDKIISVSFKAVSITADILLQALKSLQESLAAGNQNKSSFINSQNNEVKVKTGKLKLSELSGKGITDSVDVSNKNEFQTVGKVCKNHNIDYSVMATKGENGQRSYTAFFKTRDTNSMKKMLDEAIKQTQKQEQIQDQNKEQAQDQEEMSQDVKKNKAEELQSDEKIDNVQNTDKSKEKNRESMGKEEREKEEPIKSPSPEKEMPVKSNEPAAQTTDNVKREQKKEENIKEGGDSRNSAKDIKSDKDAKETARESKLHSRGADERRKEYTLNSLKTALDNKKQAEMNAPKVPQIHKDRSNDSIEASK